MSLTLVAWLILFTGLLFAAFQRSVYAVSLYMLTYFLLPGMWWWGDPLNVLGSRWNLVASLVLLAVSLSLEPPKLVGRAKKLLYVSLFMILNWLFVNFFIAGNSTVSYESTELAIKLFVLVYLMVRTIRTVDDLKIAMISILLGASYIGYEVTFNGRGRIVDNRLEGVGAPGATTANHFASLMSTIVPLVAPFFLKSKLRVKALVVLAGALIVNLVLLCNSRGAFLGTIFSAPVFIYFAPREVRSKAIKLVAVGAFGVFLLLGDARIVDQFLTTFLSEEERDSSAQSRLDFWKCGFEMIGDYPLGAGGHGFKKVHGIKYLRSAGVSEKARSVHNGYINEACEWGLQGLALRLAWYYLAIMLTISSIRRQIRSGKGDEFLILTQLSLLAGTASFLIHCIFGSLLEAEWGHWMVALMVAASLIATRLESDELEQENEASEDLTRSRKKPMAGV